VLTADELERVRACRDALLQQWRAVAAGEEMVLTF
jgi:hypothetical protein